VRRTFTFFVAITCFCAFAKPALAAGDCDELRGDERILPGEFIPHHGSAWTSLDLPLKGDVDDALGRLDYRDELPLVYSVDINGDGRSELLLTAPDGRLCGNAGCPYVLLAPRTMKRIGEFFGNLALLDERVNGYRVIQSWSRYRVYDSILDTFVFDRGAYRLVSHAIVDACGIEQWQRRMRKPK